MFSWRKNDPDGLENTTVRFRNIQMYMNYVGLCLNTEVLKEFVWKVKKKWNFTLGALIGGGYPESLYVCILSLNVFKNKDKTSDDMY